MIDIDQAAKQIPILKARISELEAELAKKNDLDSPVPGLNCTYRELGEKGKEMVEALYASCEDAIDDDDYACEQMGDKLCGPCLILKALVRPGGKLIEVTP